jgi:hypothetical protein
MDCKKLNQYRQLPLAKVSVVKPAVQKITRYLYDHAATPGAKHRAALLAHPIRLQGWRGGSVQPLRLASHANPVSF